MLRFDWNYFWSFLILGLSGLFFVSSWHNLDLLQNYSLILNDINNNDVEGLYNVRDVEDCNLIGCHDFMSIYIVSKFMAFSSFVMLISYIIFLERQRSCKKC